MQSDRWFSVSVIDYSVIAPCKVTDALVSVSLITVSLHHAKWYIVWCQCQWLQCHCTMQIDRCYGVSVNDYSVIVPWKVADTMASVSLAAVSFHSLNRQLDTYHRYTIICTNVLYIHYDCSPTGSASTWHQPIHSYGMFVSFTWLAHLQNISRM